ncbi:MAG: AraC family transcriptional regulator [Chitinivibrionales bacterium]|nr:AraC family transcriptional regulator [Chitinivibrionales bacterium]
MPFPILKHVKTDHSVRDAPRRLQLWTRLRSPQYDDFAPPLQIVSFGGEEWHGGRFFERTRSEMFGVEYVRHGSVSFVQDGKSYTVGPGQVYLLRRGVAHRYTADRPGPMRKYYIALEGALLESLLLATELDSCDHIAPDSPERVVHLFEQIRESMQHKPPGFALELSALAYRLLLELSGSRSRRYPEPVRAAIEFIDQNLTRSLTTADICAVAGLSQTHFNRLFRRHVGLSPKQFFIRHKLAWAEHLLTQSHFSIKEIAATLGYEDPLYFSSQFRAHLGVSPKRYRLSGGRRTRPRKADASGARFGTQADGG